MQLLAESAPFGYLILACCGMAFPVALFGFGAAFRSRRLGFGLGAVVIFFGVAQILAGVGGYFYLMSRVEAAIAYATPDAVEIIRAAGTQEAMSPIWVGLGAGAASIFMGMLPILVAAIRKPDPKTS